MSKISFLLVLLYSMILHIESARILAVYPTPSISHQVVFRRLTDELVRHGHEVTVITTDPAYSPGQAPANLKEIDVHDLSYNKFRDVMKKEPIGKKDDLYSQLSTILRGITDVLMLQINTKEVQDIINKKEGEYDLLLIEAYVKPTLIFSHFFQVPVILVSSLNAFDYNLKVVGAPTHPLLYPTVLHQKLYNLTNWDKIQQLYNHWVTESKIDQIEKEDDEILKNTFGPGTPKISDLFDNVHMLFLNVHPIWVDNQPIPSSVVYIGGIHTAPPKELPKDLHSYLNSSKHGVIYFSLGTNASPSLLPSEKIQMLIKVFSQLPYDVMWKWDKEVLPGKSQNIKTFKWVPQADLLGHPNVKLFITQGGLQSTDEAIIAGVPLIGIPMLGDQWYNVEKYVRHKIGIQLDLTTLTESEFKSAIERVINDKSYRENIVKLRNIIQDQPQSPLERAVWWTEHVLRHGGGRHLRASTANISWAQYLELELVFILFSALIGILLLAFIIIYMSWKLLVKNFSASIKIKKY